MTHAPRLTKTRQKGTSKTQKVRVFRRSWTCRSRTESGREEESRGVGTSSITVRTLTLPPLCNPSRFSFDGTVDKVVSVGPIFGRSRLLSLF